MAKKKLLTQRAKCSGCLALILVTKEKYGCQLFFKIEHDVVDGKAMKPIPKTACVKPKKATDYKKALKNYRIKK